MHWLSSLPAGALVAGWLGVALLVAALGRIGVRAFVPAEDRDHVPQIASPLMPALGAAFAIFAALTLAGEAGYLRTAEGLVSDEASASSRLAWAATTPGVRPQGIHAALQDYLEATRTREWISENASSGDDPATARAIARLERTVRAEAARPEIGSAASSELLTSLDATTGSRRARIAAASRQIPTLYVGTLVASGLALILNAGALTFRSRLRTSLLVGGLAMVVGLCLALLFSITAPWRGPIVVGGHPIDAIIHDLETGFFER
ncbi:MAG: hypothetical protein ABWY19_14415 [Marmoricola sp.]